MWETFTLLSSFFGLAFTYIFSANLKKKRMKAFRSKMGWGALIAAIMFAVLAIMKGSLIACACFAIWLIIGLSCLL